MNFYKPPTRPNELYHHGILGQKWGKRNGPPYPLGASDHSSSEQAAGWKKSLKVASNKIHAYKVSKTNKKIEEYERAHNLKKKNRYNPWDDLKNTRQPWDEKSNRVISDKDYRILKMDQQIQRGAQVVKDIINSTKK